MDVHGAGTVGTVDYCNTGTATRHATAPTATATDPACYRVPPVVVEIAIVKLVNGAGREHARVRVRC